MISTFDSFRRDSSGNVAMLFALLALAVMVCAGGAIDFGRWLHASRQTKAAVDSAVLAGARVMQVSGSSAASVNNAKLAANRYYQENVKDRFAIDGADTIQFDTSDNNTAFSASGNVNLATPILNLIGISHLPLMKDSEARHAMAKLASGGQGGSNIEVSMMLDVTGSMCSDGEGPCNSGNKMDALKAAAKDLIDIVVWDDQSNATSKVAIVPFSTRVRVGPDGGGSVRMKQMTNLDATWSGWYKDCIQSHGGGGSEGEGNWVCDQYQVQQVTNWKVMPCVTDRYFDSGGYDYTDDAPGSNKWLNAHDGGRMVRGGDSSNAASGSKKGVNAGDPAEHWNFNGDGDCADVGPSNEIMPLTADKTALKNRVDQLQAYGATAGALGTAWSWYTLSPNWSSIWTGTSIPESYGDLTTLQANGAPKLRKVAVLMSDGVYNTYRGWKGQDQQGMSNHAKQLCTNMKAQGIEVFTVGFALDELSGSERTIAEDTLRSCGSDVNHFYNALNNIQLTESFRDIALKLSSLYLAR